MSTFDPNHVREQLKLFHKTHQEFAYDLGVSQTSVSRWLNRRHVPNKLTQRAIANVLVAYEAEANANNLNPNAA